MDGWSDVDAMVEDKCYVSHFKLTGFEKIEVKTTVLELLYLDGGKRWFPTHEQIDLEGVILELLVERFRKFTAMKEEKYSNRKSCLIVLLMTAVLWGGIIALILAL